MGFVRSMPAQETRYEVDFPGFSGGINLRDLEVNLKNTESPELVNLWWEDGVLQSRPGQEWASGEISNARGYAAAPEPFHGKCFFHAGSYLYMMDFQSGITDDDGRPIPRAVAANVPENRGTFFRFGDWLFYKNRGAFLRISYDSATEAFPVSNVADGAFVPVTVINADPDSGAGDLYQPENCLSSQKTVWFTANYQKITETFTGDGTTRTFTFATQAPVWGTAAVYIGNAYIEPALYLLNTSAKSITFYTPPETGLTVTVELKSGSGRYQLPYKGISSVVSVTVDGVELQEDEDFEVDMENGVINFSDPPPVTDPPTQNTVRVTISKSNPAAVRQIQNCRYAAVAGTGTQLCIVLGGNPDQPNAVYWSGNTNTGLDPTYWPIPYYNLIGDTTDAVTGFGKQYADLIVFKNQSVGKLDLSVVTVDDRDSISLAYTSVNDHIGCDLPFSIQLIENNLTFANSSGGVFRVLSSSAAYENNIQCFSEKVNGTTERPGLLYDLRVAGAAELVSSHDDGRRYFLAVNSHVWVCDYTMDGNPWFYWSDVRPADWFMYQNDTYHLNDSGRVTKLAVRVFSDYGEAVRKVCQFPVRSLGTYERLKLVETVLLSLRADAPSNTDVYYQSDYETRKDHVSLPVPGWDRLSERDLSVRDLSVPRYAAVFRRRPMCRHVRHFALRLENDTAGQDLSLVSCQIIYRLQGRDR